LSNTATDHDEARDLIATILTQHHGEYVLRLGAQPPITGLFAGEVTDGSEGWTGIFRTKQEIDNLRQEITSAVEEVGGKVISIPLQE